MAHLCRECRRNIDFTGGWYRDPDGAYWCCYCWIRYGFREFYIQGCYTLY